MPSPPVNLNLLPLMRALLKHRSVTAAARSMGISQSAASQGLARLRMQMNDQLLVRFSGQMRLTPVAKSLAARVESVGTALDEIFVPSKFDLRSTQRELLIAANDYMFQLVARAMLDLQRAEAPGMRLHFVEITANLASQLSDNEIDFAVLPRFAVRDLAVSPLRYQMLRSEPPAVLMDRMHPLTALAAVSEADLAPFECIAFHGEPMGHMTSARWAPPSDVAPLWGTMLRVAVRTNNFTLVPNLLQRTDLFAIVPFGVGQQLSSVWPTEVRRLTFGPALIEHGLVWSPMFDADPAHAWFRNQIDVRIAKR